MEIFYWKKSLSKVSGKNPHKNISAKALKLRFCQHFPYNSYIRDIEFMEMKMFNLDKINNSLQVWNIFVS